MQPVLRFAQWLQYTDWAAALRYSGTVYPLVLTLHMIGLGFFGGMILFTNLRLLGWSLKRLPISKVIAALRVPKHIGITIVATCGILMASSKAEEYYYNLFFWAKMSLLGLIIVHGFAFRRSVYRSPQEPVPSQAKLAGALSSLLWIGVMICGRGIGYIEPPLEKLHAMVSSPLSLWLTRLCAWL
ncbi:MAG TPA: DUF6644 family protein [Bryobacteraceae bacterium]|jgi:hypothetical protein